MALILPEPLPSYPKAPTDPDRGRLQMVQFFGVRILKGDHVAHKTPPRILKAIISDLLEHRRSLSSPTVYLYPWKDTHVTSVRRLDLLVISALGINGGYVISSDLINVSLLSIELKKLIEKQKGKFVETKFDKPPVVRQTNAIKVPKTSVLGKPRSVNKIDVHKGLSKPVTPKNLPQTQTGKQSKINKNIETINGKKYILVIVDDYSRYTWTLFLRSKDETLEVLKDFLKMIQRKLQAQVIIVRTDRGTKDGENLDKMKEKGDLCIFLGYSTTSKGYRVYNKRTRLIVESIHLNFDEIKEMKSVANNTLGLAPQLQKTSDHKRAVLKFHDHNNEPSCSKLVPNVSPPVDNTNSSQQELDFLFSPLFEEYFSVGNQSVPKSSSLFDNSKQQDTQPTTNIQTTIEQISPTITTVHVEENNIDQAVDAPFQAYDFIKPFAPPGPEFADSSSQQVRGNPSKPVQTRRQLATDPEMYMFALTVSTVESTNIKEAMADHAWIKAMQEELHQFDRLQVLEHVDKPFGETIIKLKWLWKNKKDEDNTSLKKEFYVSQPDGFIDPDHLEKVYHLRKALYGLKQAPRSWCDELLNFLMSKGFTKGEMKFFLGLQIHQFPRDLSRKLVDQTRYHSMIQSLMYLTSGRPDIVQALCYCAHYQARPTEKHLKEVKRIFRYLKVTINMGLWYLKDSSFELTAFLDDDHVGCLDTRRSTFGGI
ncbi:retrovirus-related pol polyprotein from transposon TNT 1-94 [Tanacetum coccineum]